MSTQQHLRERWSHGVTMAWIVLVVAAGLLAAASCADRRSDPQGHRVIATETGALAQRKALSHGLTLSPTTASPLSASDPVTLSPVRRQQGGILRVGGLSSVAWQNPLWADRFDTAGFEYLVFESLLELDPEDGHLLPRLAEEWAVGSRGEVITFTLRGGVRWHDGQPFSAEDVASTWRAVRSAPVPIPHAEHLARVSRIEVPDERKVVVRLRQPDCAVLTQLGLLPVLPAHLWQTTEVAQPVARPHLMVGTGPFRLADWESGESVTLARRAEYWAGEPYLEGWVYRRYQAPEALLAAARDGVVDLFPVGPRQPPAPGLEAEFRLLTFPQGESLYLLFNQERRPLAERDVRHGLALALDREAIAAQAGGQEGLLTSILPPCHWSLFPDLRSPGYDPAEARRLLAVHGEQPSLTVKVWGGDHIREEIALLVAQAYREVGVEARLEVLEGGPFLGDLFDHDFDVALLASPFPRDPDQTSLWHSREITPGLGFNFGSYASRRVDALLDAGRTAEGCAEAARAPLYGQLAALLAEDRAADFLLAPCQVVALDRKVMGAAPSPFAGLYWNAAQWSVGQVVR